MLSNQQPQSTEAQWNINPGRKPDSSQDTALTQTHRDYVPQFMSGGASDRKVATFVYTASSRPFNPPDVRWATISLTNNNPSSIDDRQAMWRLGNSADIARATREDSSHSMWQIWLKQYENRG